MSIISIPDRSIWRTALGFAALVGAAILLCAIDFRGQAALWENVHWTLATWGMTALGYLGWRLASGRTRLIRGIMTLGLASYSIGQILWDVQWARGNNPFPAPSDVFYLGIAPFLLIGIILTFVKKTSAADETALRVDAATMFITCATLIFAVYAPRTSSLTNIQTIVIVAYPVMFLATAGNIFTGALARHSRFGSSSAPYLLLMGLTMSGVCWVIWNSLALDMVIPPGTLVGYGFSVSHLVVGLGVATWDSEESTNETFIHWTNRIIRVLPILTIPTAVVALEWGRNFSETLRFPIIAGGFSVILLTVIRQSLLFWERDNLLESERAALQRAEMELTERKKIEEERERLILELGQRNTELEQFTYTVSHDLKTPLVTIQGFLGYVEEHALGGDLESLKSDSQRIKDAAGRMQLLLDELLELARIGHQMNPPVDVPFNAIVEEALSVVESQIMNRGVTVHVQEDLPAVHGDKIRLAEVVQNLVDNAIKFMGSQPDPCIEIGMEVRHEVDSAVFFVRDNGIGILPQYQDRIFGLFNKLNAKTEGTGVGLALVKRIVEYHGGRIWVESEGQNQGSTFCFTLASKTENS